MKHIIYASKYSALGAVSLGLMFFGAGELEGLDPDRFGGIFFFVGLVIFIEINRIDYERFRLKDSLLKRFLRHWLSSWLVLYELSVAFGLCVIGLSFGMVESLPHLVASFFSFFLFFGVVRMVIVWSLQQDQLETEDRYEDR